MSSNTISTCHWLTGLTSAAEPYNLPERAISVGKKIGEVVDREAIAIPSRDTHTFVGWDQGRISKVEEDRPLYSEEFSPCIAILARALPENSSLPSYTALHHMFMRPHAFGRTLKQLVEKIQNGTIEIFISGGTRESQDDWSTIHQIIKQSEQENKNIQFRIVEDLFGINDLNGDPYKKTADDICYQGKVGIQYVGFDEHQRPFQILDVCSRYQCDPPFTIIWV